MFTNVSRYVRAGTLVPPPPHASGASTSHTDPVAAGARPLYSEPGSAEEALQLLGTVLAVLQQGGEAVSVREPGRARLWKRRLYFFSGTSKRTLFERLGDAPIGYFLA